MVQAMLEENANSVHATSKPTQQQTQQPTPQPKPTQQPTPQPTPQPKSTQQPTPQPQQKEMTKLEELHRHKNSGTANYFRFRGCF